MTINEHKENAKVIPMKMDASSPSPIELYPYETELTVWRTLNELIEILEKHFKCRKADTVED